MTDNEHQFQIGCERFVVAIEKALQCMDEHFAEVGEFAFSTLHACSPLRWFCRAGCQKAVHTVLVSNSRALTRCLERKKTPTEWEK